MDGITLLRRLFLAALFALVAAPVPARAEGVVDQTLLFGFGAGPSFPTGDAADALGTGFAAQGVLRVYVPILPFKPRLNVTYLDHSIENMAVVDLGHTGGETFSEGGVKAWTGLVDAQLNIIPLGPVKPYLLLSGGWASVNTQLEGGSSGGSVDHTTTQFTYGAGAGVTVALLGLNAYGEVRVLEIDDDAGPLALDTISLVPVTLGITF